MIACDGILLAHNSGLSMSAIHTRLIGTTISFLLITSPAFAQHRTARRANHREALISALITAEDVRGIWGDDAMYIFTAAPEIEAIFGLGRKAIPLLIDHLDDRRLLKVTVFNASGDRQEALDVTVGAACFDLLTYIIRTDARFFDQPCVREIDEGHVSSCALARYAVFPEHFWSHRKQDENGLWFGEGLIVPKRVTRAKRNWQTAYRQHRIKYKSFQ
jgi:hypothetical protein